MSNQEKYILLVAEMTEHIKELNKICINRLKLIIELKTQLKTAKSRNLELTRRDNEILKREEYLLQIEASDFFKIENCARCKEDFEDYGNTNKNEQKICFDCSF